MKNLEKLGISPAPWKAEGNEVSYKAWDSFYGMSFDTTVADCYNAANARLIAAAPELYEALRGMCEWLSEGIKERGSINPHWAKAMDALAAASGESEVAK